MPEKSEKTAAQKLVEAWAEAGIELHLGEHTEGAHILVFSGKTDAEEGTQEGAEEER